MDHLSAESTTTAVPAESPEQLNQLVQAILGNDDVKLNPAKLIARTEKLKRLQLPMGSEALLQAMSDQCIAQEVASRRRRRRDIGVMEGLTDRGNTPLPVAETEDLDTARLIHSLLSKRGDDVVAAMSVLFEHVNQQTTAINQAAFLRFMSERLVQAQTDNEPVQRDVIRWQKPGADDELEMTRIAQTERYLTAVKEEAVYLARRAFDTLLGKCDKIPPYYRPSLDLLAQKRDSISSSATRDYLSASEDLDGFADRYSTLVFSGCWDELFNLKFAYRIKEIFTNDPELSSLNRIRAEVMEWFSEDIHCLFRRLAGDHYPELKPAHKEKIFSAINDLL